MQTLYKIWLLAHSTFIEGVRHRALWAIVVLAVILTGSNILFTEIYTWDLGKVSIEFGLSAIAVTGLLLIFFMGLKILADDLERHRVYMVLARPVQGWQYVTGKFLGLALILLAATLILGLSSFVSMEYVLWRYPEYVPPNFSWLVFLMALYCQLLSLMTVLALSFMWFCFASQPFIAIILSVASYLAGQNMELLRQIVEQNVETGEIHRKLVVGLSWVFPNLSFFDQKMVAAYGLPFNWTNLLLLTAYGVSYIGLLLLLATWFFNRKELA